MVCSRPIEVTGEYWGRFSESLELDDDSLESCRYVGLGESFLGFCEAVFGYRCGWS